MISGNSFQGFRRPSLQGPDTSGGGTGGGGTAPPAPSDVTTAVPASTWIAWGAAGHRYISAGPYAAWLANLGFAGFAGNMGEGGLKTTGSSNTQLSSATTAAALGTAYNQQKCYEGLAQPTDPMTNGGSPGGMFKYKHDSAPSMKCYLKIGVPTSSTLGSFSNSSFRAEVATLTGQMAAECLFLNGNGIAFDHESGAWQEAGISTAQNRINLEQYGYQVGVALWTAFPAADLLLYYWIAEGSWHALGSYQGSPGTPPYAPVPIELELCRTFFYYGLMRGHMDANATGKMRFFDHWFYRGVQFSGATIQTALKWNTQGRLAVVSRGVSAATWSHIAPYLFISPFSWAGTDAGTYYPTNQEPQPTYTDNLEQYRQWGMGGYRAEFNLGGDGTPGIAGSSFGGEGLWAGHDNYSFPSGRAAGMLSSVSTNASYSTTAPTLSASASGAGSTRTLSGTAAHAYGIHYVEAYLYPSGTRVNAQMTFNLGGGTPTTGIANCFMDWTLSLTGVATGNYAIVTAHSTLGQQHSTVVGPF